MYTYMTSSKGINTCRCILRKTETGCILNIEYCLYNTGKTYVKILNQEKGKDLIDIDSWIFEDEKDIKTED